jgi:hypothetical protein
MKTNTPITDYRLPFLRSYLGYAPNNLENQR